MFEKPWGENIHSTNISKSLESSKENAASEGKQIYKTVATEKQRIDRSKQELGKKMTGRSTRTRCPKSYQIKEKDIARSKTGRIRHPSSNGKNI